MGGAVPSDAHALRVFQNPGHSNGWIGIKLVGVKTNRAAIGARVTVSVQNRNGGTQSFYRTVDTRGSWGASPLEQHIGLGPAATIKNIEIWWPTSNTRQEFKDVGLNQYIEIKEFEKTYSKRTKKTYHIVPATSRPISTAKLEDQSKVQGAKR
jgi:ASPIC and UnbV